MDFMKFKQAIAEQFEMMSKNELFRMDADKDSLWNTYLSSFPEGTNPLYRERTEHDCSCCRHFIKSVGNVVAIIDNNIVSIWDIEVDDPAYQFVANAMSELVKSAPIYNLFLHTENTAGTDKNFEDIGDSVKTWNHFFVTIPHSNTRERNFVCNGIDIGPRLSASRADHDVLLRSLLEIGGEAIDTTLELIAQNSLYRGEEHKFAVTTFQGLKKKFDKLDDNSRDLFVWSSIKTVPASVSKIRNTAIGTLLVDLSNGMDLDRAVRSFEAMVAPSNYKRPTALVTQSMINAAKEKIEELGLTSSLERRYAELSDISINNIIFADRTARQAMTANVFDELPVKPLSTKNFDKVETVSIEKFIADIVPKATSIEIMVANGHISNFVSLIAPVDPASKNMFKWDNKFSWSYSGDFADSIKERVKKAGGNVSGDFCCRLAWHNFDDLDFHMVEPNRHEISFAHKISPSGGQLDVDMNAYSGHTREPVENIFYSSKNMLRKGVYHLFVHQFRQRESNDYGFEAEIDFMGTVYNFAYDKRMSTGGRVTVAKFDYDGNGEMKLIESLPLSRSSKEVWNIKTEQFHKVNVMMMSPNYWDDREVGNRHYFFMLDGCKNEEGARGFFNEFLKEELNPHRKVLELVGNKLKTESSDNQLSGLGFSSTKRNEILVKVSGNFNRIIKVMI